MQHHKSQLWELPVSEAETYSKPPPHCTLGVLARDAWMQISLQHTQAVPGLFVERIVLHSAGALSRVGV